MIVRARITSVAAEKLQDIPIESIDLNIGLIDVIPNGKILEIRFEYFVKYKPNVGSIKMQGVFMGETDEFTAKRIADQWKKDGKIEEQYAKFILNSINYKCGTEAMLIVKLVDLVSPIIPPLIEVKNT